MSSALQNRLVGTVIVVAVAVIFLPDLLDGKKQPTEKVFKNLPVQPSVSIVSYPKDVNVDQIKDVVTRTVEIVSDQVVDGVNSNPESGPVIKTMTDDVSEPHNASNSSSERSSNSNLDEQVALPGSLEQETVVDLSDNDELVSAGWVVQLGTFRHKNNVNEVLNVLEKAGYRAFSRPVNTSSGTLTKVFVGPDLQKEKLDKSLSHLKELTKLQGRVTSFTVR